jgi:hypothetical protein
MTLITSRTLAFSDFKYQQTQTSRANPSIFHDMVTPVLFHIDDYRPGYSDFGNVKPFIRILPDFT